MRNITIKPIMDSINFILSSGAISNRKMYLSIVLIFTVAFMELLCLGSLMPLVGLLTGGEDYLAQSKLGFLESFFESASDKELLFYLLAWIVLVYSSKAVVTTYFLRYFGILVFEFKKNISHALARYYLLRPYSESINSNSGDLQRDLTIESSELTARVLIPLVYLASEVFILFCICGFLLFVSPLPTAFAFSLFAITSIVFLVFSGRKTRAWGYERQVADGKRMQLGNEILNNLEELKISGKEKVFLDVLLHSLQRVTQVEAKQFFLNHVPRVLLEYSAVLIFSLVVLLAIFAGEGTTKSLQLIALFAAAAFRILPSFNRLITSVNNINFGHKIVKLVSENLKSKFEVETLATRATLPEFEKLSFLNVTYGYSRDRKILDIPEFTINAGTFVGVLGPSGSGKSSLLKLITCLVEPTNGQIELNHSQINEKNVKVWQSAIGYVPQHPYFFDQPIANNIATEIHEEKIDFDRVMATIEKVNLSSKFKDLATVRNMHIGENGKWLSGGQRQRVAIARALYKEPKILIFDEALSSLDENSKHRVLSTILKLKGKTTVVFVTHDEEELTGFDLKYTIDGGLLKKLI